MNSFNIKGNTTWIERMYNILLTDLGCKFDLDDFYNMSEFIAVNIETTHNLLGKRYICILYDAPFANIPTFKLPQDYKKIMRLLKNEEKL